MSTFEIDYTSPNIPSGKGSSLHITLNPDIMCRDHGDLAEQLVEMSLAVLKYSGIEQPSILCLATD